MNAADGRRVSRPFARAVDHYRDLEDRLKADTAILGPLGDPSPFFLQWRQLFADLCNLERRYQARQRAR